MSEPLLTRYMQPLLAGRRAECFEIMARALQQDWAAADLMCEVVWPAMAQIERLYKCDRINTAAENMAGRINRTVADQLQAHLPHKPRNEKRAIVVCSDDVREEVGAQMVADLLQADGWEIYFLGGGVPHDEVLAAVGNLRPNMLLIFGSIPAAVPEVRKLVHLIRDIGVCATMNIVVSGGIFNRADGLWQEVGADAFAPSAREVLALANDLGPREPQAPRVGIVKKRRRRQPVALSA